MKSPSWLQGYVESLDIQPLGRYRSDCPVCARKNTFSVSDDGLQRLWYCFHADCNVSGRTGITLTKEFARHALSKSQTNASVPRTSNTYEMPDTFVRSVHAYDAYLSGRTDIRYDFKRNRVVFLVKDGNKVVDAVGRSIDGRSPKWYRYGSDGRPFTCGGADNVVIVEDCASACCISHHVSGLALLGTNLLDSHIDVIKNYKRVFVALDKDATDKAVDMVKTLCKVVPTKLMVLPRDLKNMTKDERDDFLRNRIDR